MSFVSEGTMDSAEIDRDAELVYNYHRMSMPLTPASAIFCLCSLDTRVARRAAQLFLDGVGTYIVFSGGSGKLTASVFDKPEAEIFADIALEMGVPAEKIVVESESSNTGENVRFTRVLLEKTGLDVRSFILVQKPYMERRTFATFAKQWGEPTPRFSVMSPQVDFWEYPDEANPKDWVIHIMVGDLVRIRKYAVLGFQVHQDIPDEVWEAGQRLISARFDKHLPS